MLNPKIIGAFIGLVIGAVLIWYGALKAFLLGLFILIGWLIGKFFTGEIDLLELYERFMISRGRKPPR